MPPKQIVIAFFVSVLRVILESTVFTACFAITYLKFDSALKEFVKYGPNSGEKKRDLHALLDGLRQLFLFLIGWTKIRRPAIG